MVSRADFLCKKMLAEIFLSLGKMHLGFFFFFNLAGALLLSYFGARNAAEELSESCYWH